LCYLWNELSVKSSVLGSSDQELVELQAPIAQLGEITRLKISQGPVLEYCVSSNNS
jgi:hypothetical protein